MSGLDARFLFTEIPSAHMHTLKIAVVDVSARAEPLTPERLRSLLEARLERMPVLRRRVVPVPHGLGNPALIDDLEFDLRRHLRHVGLAPPGEERALSDVVASIAAVPLPRDRPLWELTVVEGLAGGQVGFIVKIPPFPRRRRRGGGLADERVRPGRCRRDHRGVRPGARAV